MQSSNSPKGMHHGRRIFVRNCQIENQAALLLTEFEVKRGLRLVAPIPVEELVERHLKLTIDFDDLHSRLGVVKVGNEPEVLGALWANFKGNLH